MSYFDCDRCGKRHHIFGQSDIEKLAKEYNIPATAQIPINNKLALASDRGMIELYDGDWLDKLIERIEKL